jgi:hypothetical protein
MITAAPARAADNLSEWSMVGLDWITVLNSNGGSGVSVMVLDGKTDCAHPDLSTHCEFNPVVGGRYRTSDDHGTHTAGIVAGKKTGIAPNAKIINYGVFDDRGWVPLGNELVDAWTAGKAKGASIASMSFGCDSMALCFSSGELKAMGSASLPLLFVKAAGNESAVMINEPVAITQADALAAMNRIMLVGSVELNGTLSSYSNRPGDNCLLYSGSNSCSSDLQWKQYFIVAPGSDIYSTLPGNSYGYMSGTSMATPLVAGAAALLESRWPHLKAEPESVADILFQTARDLGAPGTDGVYGRGLLDIGKAFSFFGYLEWLYGPQQARTVNATSITASPATVGIPKTLASVPVYDVYGRDFPLAEAGGMQLRVANETVHRLLGRRLLGLGGQADWSSALFAPRGQQMAFVGFKSLAEPASQASSSDDSVRMGVDLPFKGGSAQIRMTGASSSRLDLAYDPSLAPLSFFASSALLNSSLFGQATFNLGANKRFSVYGTSNMAGSVWGLGQSPQLDGLDRNSTARFALTGRPADHKQQGVGVSYWTKPDAKTVIGFNASYIGQQGGYYDMSSTLPGLDGQSRMVNLGAVASRSMGSWEVSLAGEMTRISHEGNMDGLRLTPSNIASAELRVRKAGIAFGDADLADSASLALVVPPRAVSGALQLDYMGPTADRMGREPKSVRYALSDLEADPMRIEAGYRLAGASGWSLDLSGGLNLEQSYAGAGELLGSLHLGF